MNMLVALQKNLFRKRWGLYGFNMPYLNFIFLLPALFFLVSCSSLRTIPVEIAFMPKDRVPEEIQSFTLVNRATDYRYQNHRADSLQQYFYRRQFNLDTLLLDSQAADTLLLVLGDLLFESGRFDIVIPDQRSLSADSYSFLPTTISWEDADSLTGLYNTDAVLSLDHFKTKVITNYDKESVYDQYSNKYFDAYFAQMDIAYETLFRIYYPKTRQIVKNIAIIDTLHWEDADREIRPLFNRFTTVKAALLETGIEAALRLSARIAPEWRITRRTYFFKGHPKLEQAHLLINQGDWEGATALWLELAEIAGSGSLRSKAEYNLALAYEMQGNMDEAIRWGVKSYETMYRPITYNYLEKLNDRKKQIENQ
jgi:tetratricopeptide (TPR) repeat protein